LLFFRHEAAPGIAIPESEICSMHTASSGFSARNAAPQSAIGFAISKIAGCFADIHQMIEARYL